MRLLRKLWPERTIKDRAPRPETPALGRARRILNLARRIALAILVIVAVAWLYARARDFAYNSSYFDIQHVVVEGVGPVVREKILGAISPADASRNLLAASPRVVREQVLTVPEVRDVEVRRKLPDTLIITCRERIAAAILVGEKNIVIDADLVAMGFLEGKEFLNSPLPLITAEALTGVELGKPIADPRVVRAWETLTALQKHSQSMSVVVSETHIDWQGNVSLHFEGGAEARLGKRSPARVLPVLEAFWNQTEGMKDIEYADLRFSNQVTFMKRGAALAARANTHRPANED